MRRLSRVALRVADLFSVRVQEVRAGNSVDPFIELGRTRVMLAMLVNIGLLFPDDWPLPSVPLSSRGAAIDAMRVGRPPLLDVRTMDGNGSFTAIDRLILAPHLGSIAVLVVEMAGAVLVHETMLAGMVSAASRPRARGRQNSYDPLVVTLKSALPSDPEAFLVDARARFDAARDDVAKAKRRINYVASDRKADASMVPRSRVRVVPNASSPGIIPDAGSVLVRDSEDHTKTFRRTSFRDVPAAVPFEGAATSEMVILVRGLAMDPLRPTCLW